MASVCNVAVVKEHDKFVWKLGLSLWEFKQWPAQLLWRDGLCLHDHALQNVLKLTEDAVRFSLGYEAGMRQGRQDKHDEIVLG